MASIKKSPYRLIRRPRITEKAAVASGQSNAVVFDVHPLANKVEIKNAVEKIFDVKVDSVRTVNVRGKIKRVGAGGVGKRPNWKKAYVSLAEGSTLDMIEGL